MFKFGTTSYIIPAGIHENILFLKDYVTGIQIILFELPEENMLVNPIDTALLYKLKKLYNLHFFIHLPLNINFAASSIEERKKTSEYLKIYFDLGEKIETEFYVAHLNLPAEWKNTFYTDYLTSEKYKLFSEYVNKTLDFCFSKIPIASKFLIENIDYNIQYLNEFIFDRNIGLCMDIGHLLLCKTNVEIISK